MSNNATAPDVIAEYRARVEDCKTYNFGMFNANKLAHEDAPALLDALDAAGSALAERAVTLRATATRMLDEVMNDRTKTRQDHEDAHRYVAYAAESEAGFKAFREAVTDALGGAE